MNQDVGSIMGHFYNLFPCKIYTEEVPENFMVPSMYFPPAFSFDGNDSNNTYTETSNLSVKLFHKSGHEALDGAERIANAVRKKRMLIPVVNQDGTPANDFIRINKIEVRPGAGLATIILNWTNRHFYEREVQPVLQTVTGKTNMKE